MSEASDTDAEDDQFPFISQEADGDNWYFDMRGAVVGLDTRKPLNELQEDLSHFREYLEEKKHEWIRESVFREGDRGLAATLYTDMKLIRAQLESCKSAIIGRRGKPTASSLDIEWPRQAFQRLKPVFVMERHQRAEAEFLKQLTWTTRPAVIGTNRLVVILKNGTKKQARFMLRGYRLDGSMEDIGDLTIEPENQKEIGSFQGWDGNWTKGERFEIWTFQNPIRAWHATLN